MLGSGEKDTFDRLVGDLNAQERHEMLGRINKNAPETIQLIDTETSNTGPVISLLSKLDNESIFYKFFLWLRSLFSKRTKTSIYNEDLLASMAKKVNHNHPGLINHHNFVLDYLFYDRLKSLKEASDFFKPYFSFIENAQGDFYIFLSSFVVPELNDNIKKATDPFSIPFSTNPTMQLKNELTRKLDDILNSIDSDTRKKLYYSIDSLNWLKLFTKLPYLHFLSQFTNVSGSNYTCPYVNATQDYNAFAALFVHVKSISSECLEALYLFSQKKELKQGIQEKDVERAVKEFMTVANGHLVAIKMFISGVPIIKVGKLINSNYDWEPENIEGSEGWFPTFRSQWRKNIDILWNDWIRERKKNLLGNNLKEDFNLQEFPVMAWRPWKKMWTSIPFSYELTGGFISWFATEKYDEIITPLNEVMLEGIFIKTENRKEYSDGLNLFVSANKQMLDLLLKLTPDGLYGSVFEDISANKLRTLKVQNQIDSMMSSIESEILNILDNFKTGTKKITNVFNGFFDDIRDGTHEPLQNWTTIKGHQNREWRDKLREIRNLIKRAIFYISELEPIDAETKHK